MFFMAKMNCYDTALGMLSRRGYAVKEMAGALKKKDFAGHEIADVIDRLEEKKFLDDVAFALSRARYRATLSGWGKVRILQELAQKGVAEDVAATAVRELVEPEEEFSETHDFQAAANDLMARRFKPLEDVVPYAENGQENSGLEREKYQKEVQRRVAFLMRRGYSLAQAKEALRVSDLEE